MIDINSLIKECIFKASRSSGPGGQHVNKVSTKVELRFNVYGSKVLSEKEKAILRFKLAGQLTSESELIINAKNERSQLKNKDEAIRKFTLIIRNAFMPIKKRKPTRPTNASKVQRRELKKQCSEKKQRRKKPEL